jgi:hypothetical protein
MDRRASFLALLAAAGGVFTQLGCRGHDVGEVKKDTDKDLVGNRAAGAETFKPLIDESLCKLLNRQSQTIQQVADGQPPVKRICFVGLENKSSEDLGDFKAQIVETIDNRLNQMPAFEQVSMRFTEAGLREARLRPDELFLPNNQRKFLAVMEAQGKPFDYLLFASITSGTTMGHKESQKDYMLTLELVDIATGKPDKESATIRKGYSKSHGLR